MPGFRDLGVTVVNPTEISVMYGYITWRMTMEISVMYGSEGVQKSIFAKWWRKAMIYYYYYLIITDSGDLHYSEVKIVSPLRHKK